MNSITIQKQAKDNNSVRGGPKMTGKVIKVFREWWWGFIQWDKQRNVWPIVFGNLRTWLWYNNVKIQHAKNGLCSTNGVEKDMV